MKPDFDWHSEEEFVIESEADFASHRENRKISRYLLAGLSIAAVLLLGWVIIRQLRNYVAETASDTGEEIESSLSLLLNVSGQGDLELLSSFISGRDTEWAQNQLFIIENGLFLDRTQFGLSLIEEDELESPDISFSADISEAVLEANFSYMLGNSLSDLDTVDLRQIFIFRKGRDRWLLSPPGREFWGSESAEVGRYVTAIYPARDSELTRRLAADLEGTAAAACGIMGEACPDNLHVTIQFSTNPEALFQLDRPDQDLLDRQIIVLPAVSLIGRPVDNGGYRAVYRLYSMFLVKGMFEQQSRYACCVRLSFFDALSNVQLYHLGLLASPGEAAESFELEQLFEIWQRDENGEPIAESEQQEIQAFINTLAADLSPNQVNEIQQKMIAEKDFWGWLNEISPRFMGSG